MGLKTVITDNTEIEEQYRDLYKEQDRDGDTVYVLDLEGVDDHPDVANLSSAYRREKEKRQTVARERDQFRTKAEQIPEDIEEETFQQVMERLRQGEDPFAKAEGSDPAKIKEQIERQYKQQIEQRDQTLQQRDQQVRQMVVDQGLTQALTKAKVTNPGFQKAAKKLLADQVEVTEDDQGTPTAKVDTDMGPMSIEQYVQQWTSSDEGSAFVDGNQGGNARGNGSTNGGRGRREITREQYDQMSPAEAQEFFRNGGRISG